MSEDLGVIASSKRREVAPFCSSQKCAGTTRTRKRGNKVETNFVIGKPVRKYLDGKPMHCPDCGLVLLYQRLQREGT